MVNDQKYMRAPFPYFGGKSSIAGEVWGRLGSPKQYIEPFCGSAAMLLAAPRPASLEVICDASGFIANFWRAVKHQPRAVAEWADYPVSHIDLGARHVWLVQQIDRIGAELLDADWPGDAKVAGWWLWGQCCWIGSGWCESPGTIGVGNAGMGVQAAGQIPHVGNAGRGVQAAGKIPHVSDAGRGVQAAGQIPNNDDDCGLLTTTGKTALVWLKILSNRLERVRVIHGDWSRCLNHHYGGKETAVFLDPPYTGYEDLYRHNSSVARDVGQWARENEHLRIALCGHVGEHELDGWDAVPWSRGRLTYGGENTTDNECVWYSPGCLPARHGELFAMGAA